MRLSALLQMSLALSMLFGTCVSVCGKCKDYKCPNFKTYESRFLDVNPFFTSSVQIYAQCCNLCAAIDKCASFNYDVKTHICSLLSEASVGEDMVSSPSSVHGIYTNATRQAKMNMCITRPCKEDQVCVSTTSGHGNICLKASLACSAAPPVPNMTAEMGLLTLASGEADYTCDTGYLHESGSGHSVCAEDSGWIAPTMVCKFVDCGPPPGSTLHFVSFMTTTYQSTAVYQCGLGYYLPGNGTSVCHADGQWSPTCQRNDCGPPPSKHSMGVNATSTLYESEAIYECAVGYNGTGGESTSICQADGKWTEPSLICEPVNCGDTAVIEGMELVTVTGATYQSIATYKCAEGYTSQILKGTSNCDAEGQWSPPSLTCTRKNCKSPSTKHGMKFSITTTLYESEAIYECAVGYNATDGNGTSKCQADGTWTEPTLNCEPVNCGDPPVYEGMKVVAVQEKTYQGTATYMCEEGYNPKYTGKTSTCKSDGTWSQPRLTCMIVDCGPPPGSPLHNVNFAMTTYQSTAVYQCGLGYYVPGNGTSVCQANGQWSPTCQKIPGLTGTKSLSASSTSELVCRNVMSDPVNSTYYWGNNDADGNQIDGERAFCDNNEILTGCSSLNSDAENRGSGISGRSCYARNSLGTQSVARCCKIPGLQCEYIRKKSESVSCYKNFQLLDCTCRTFEGTCYSTMNNNTCLKDSLGSHGKEQRSAVCCTYDNLICYVKEVLGRDIAENQQMSLTCASGETMTACSGFNTGEEIQKALIESLQRSQCEDPLEMSLIRTLSNAIFPL